VIIVFLCFLFEIFIMCLFSKYIVVLHLVIIITIVKFNLLNNFNFFSVILLFSLPFLYLHGLCFVFFFFSYSVHLVRCNQQKKRRLWKKNLPKTCGVASTIQTITTKRGLVKTPTMLCIIGKSRVIVHFNYFWNFRVFSG
jgi:hypothetical protein